MRRLTVGHHHKAVNINAAITLDGKHNVLPTAAFNVHRGHGPELFGLGRLPCTVLTLAKTYHHDTAAIRTVHHDMEILCLRSEFEGFLQVNANSESIATEAGTLHCKHLF